MFDENKTTFRPKAEIDWFWLAFSLPHFILCLIGSMIVIRCSKLFPLDHPDSCVVFRNLYNSGFSFDFHVYLSENETNFDPESRLVWTKKGLTYGDVQLVHSFSTNVSISEVGQYHRAVSLTTTIAAGNRFEYKI